MSTAASAWPAAVDGLPPTKPTVVISDSAHQTPNHPLVRFTSDSAILAGDTLTVRGDLEAAGRQIQLAFDTTVRRIGAELAVEATTPVDHRQLGMTWSPLGMLRAPAQLSVRARLVPDR